AVPNRMTVCTRRYLSSPKRSHVRKVCSATWSRIQNIAALVIRPLDWLLCRTDWQSVRTVCQTVLHINPKTGEALATSTWLFGERGFELSPGFDRRDILRCIAAAAKLPRL